MSMICKYQDDCDMIVTTIIEQAKVHYRPTLLTASSSDVKEAGVDKITVQALQNK